MSEFSRQYTNELLACLPYSTGLRSTVMELCAELKRAYEFIESKTVKTLTPEVDEQDSKE